jgi:hypothetical protein
LTMSGDVTFGRWAFATSGRGLGRAIFFARFFVYDIRGDPSLRGSITRGSPPAAQTAGELAGLLHERPSAISFS